MRKLFGHPPGRSYVYFVIHLIAQLDVPIDAATSPTPTENSDETAWAGRHMQYSFPHFVQLVVARSFSAKPKFAAGLRVLQLSWRDPPKHPPIVRQRFADRQVSLQKPNWRYLCLPCKIFYASLAEIRDKHRLAPMTPFDKGPCLGPQSPRILQDAAWKRPARRAMKARCSRSSAITWPISPTKCGPICTAT